jgi:hypothetical protein
MRGCHRSSPKDLQRKERQVGSRKSKLKIDRYLAERNKMFGYDIDKRQTKRKKANPNR